MLIKLKNFATLALLYNFNDIIVFARLGETPQCPAGWDQVGGNNADISGCGLENCDQRYNKNTIEDCKNHCLRDDRCKSFSWAPLNGDQNHPGKTVCTIYDTDISTQTWGPQQVMCKPTPTIRSIFLSESAFCPTLFGRAPQMDGLNGDLNQSAGGKDIFLCLAFHENFGTPITGLKLQQSGNCGSGWERALQASSLNGDLNQSAGGKDIYLCYSRITSFGLPISNINVRQNRPLDTNMPLRPDGLNGDLNQSAGGKDIFLELIRTVAQTAPPVEIKLPSLYLSEYYLCPTGYARAPQVDSLNGDLNQSAGGKDIFLCLNTDFSSHLVTGVKLQQNPNCGAGWVRADQAPTLNGDLNQDAGGKDIYLCYSDLPSLGTPLTNIYVREQRPSEARLPERPDGLNGDLNQSAGGKDIYLELFRQPEVNSLPAENSLPALTRYNFGGYPNPGYLPVEICAGFVFSFGCTNVGPCWHAQQVVAFVDNDYLYTFYTMSQSRHGKAYMLKTPLTKANDASLPAVSGGGSVHWYEQTTNFNHPGDLVIKDRIILTAGQNWDPTSFGEDFACGFGTGFTLGGSSCNCFADLASDEQALIIWDFRESLSRPIKHKIEKKDFNQILSPLNQMDDSDADDLWGGDVNGELIINFEWKFLRWTGGSLGDVRSWEEVTNINFPASCPGEIVGEESAGKLFAKINGGSFFASFVVGNPCYNLRPVTYNASDNTLSADCAGMQTVCTPGGQLVDYNDKARAFQTITEGPDGKVYMVSLDIHGDTTQVMVSQD